MTILAATVLLLLVIDPFGNIPFFLSALRDVAPGRRKIVMLRELLIALAVLVGFLFGGQMLLDGVGISEPSLTVAGGVILFLISLRMVFPSRRRFGEEDSLVGEPFIVPLAIPFIAGPSAMASVLLISSREPARQLEWLLAIVLAWAISGAILFLADELRRLLGARGLVAVERLMGMVLVALAVQMLMTGVSQFVSDL